MFPTNIKKVSSTPTSFNGSQSSNHEFEVCDTSDELLDELANSDRLNSTNEKALTVVVVSYLGDDLYGLPDKMNAKILQEVSLESDKQTIINENNPILRYIFLKGVISGLFISGKYSAPLATSCKRPPYIKLINKIL